MIASIDLVGKELRDGNDELAQWVKQRPAHFIRNDDAETQVLVATIIQAVMDGDYNNGNRDNFLAKADPWIIAKAKNLGATVVTHEAHVGPTTKKVKIPNICIQFGVPCMNTFHFLRELNARFVLAS